MELTKSLEEYISTIYILEKTNKKIRVTDIATKMLITKPSVNRALKNLREKGYVNFEPYTDITLTDEGREVAQEISKKYDIVKIFLAEILGVSQKTAEIDSLKIKAVISEETEQKLPEFMTHELKIDELKCNHSWENSRCRVCKRPLKNLKGGQTC